MTGTIFSMVIHDYKYQRVKEMNDKISLDREQFLYRTLSTIQCVLRYALIPTCESVFHFKSSCKGYSVVYSPSLSNLILLSGARYYVNIEKQTKNTTTKRSTEDTATELNTDDTTTKRNSDDTTTERNTKEQQRTKTLEIQRPKKTLTIPRPRDTLRLQQPNKTAMK